MYLHMFIATSSYPPIMGGKKPSFSQKARPLLLMLNTAKNSFCAHAYRASRSTFSRNFMPIPAFCAHGPSIMKPRYESLISGNSKDNSASPDRRLSKKILGEMIDLDHNLVVYLRKNLWSFLALVLRLGEFPIIWCLFVELKNGVQI